MKALRDCEDVARGLLGGPIPPLRQMGPPQTQQSLPLLSSSSCQASYPSPQSRPHLGEIRILLLSTHSAIFRISQMPRNLAPASKGGPGAPAKDNTLLFA